MASLTDPGSNKEQLLTQPRGGSARDPEVGDAVHVVGHGPAQLLAVESTLLQGQFKVKFPDGSETTVDRSEILVHEAASLPRRRSGAAAPSSPQLGPRQVEYLSRAFDDESRNIGTSSATFGLVATMVGGGVLSLPYAMSQCGVALGTIILCISGWLSGWTLDMLVQAARCTGCDSFELVGYAAFGERARKGTVWIVFIICWLTQIAYFVLLADLLHPTVELAGPHLFEGWSEKTARRVIVSCAALLLSPMCFQKNLSALSFMCFASVGSVVLVGGIVGWRALSSAGETHEIAISRSNGPPLNFDTQVALRFWPEDWVKALYVVPMFGVSFLCHFNALPTHQELQRPTRQRMRRVFALCVGFTTCLYLAVSITGYLWAGDCTCGNILLNFQKNDAVVAVGRGALALVLMLNFPLICQPCRNTLYRLISPCLSRTRQPAELDSSADRHVSLQPTSLEQSRQTSADNGGIVMVEESSTPQFTSREGAQGSSTAAAGAPAPPPPIQTTAPARGSQTSPSSPRSPRSPELSPRTSSSPSQVHAYRREDTRGLMPRGSTLTAIDTFLPKDETVLQSSVEYSPLERYIMTTVILISTLLVSLFMGSILVVWSILGSTVAFMIAFLMPAAFWLSLVGPSSKRWQVRAAWAMIIVISLLAIVCTVLTILNLSAPPCPLPKAVPSF